MRFCTFYPCLSEILLSISYRNLEKIRIGNFDPKERPATSCSNVHSKYWSNFSRFPTSGEPESVRTIMHSDTGYRYPP